MRSDSSRKYTLNLPDLAHLTCFSFQRPTPASLFLILDAIFIHNYQYLRVVMSFCQSTTKNFADEMLDPLKRRDEYNPQDYVSSAQLELTFALASKVVSSAHIVEQGGEDSDNNYEDLKLEIDVNRSEVWQRSLK